MRNTIALLKSSRPSIPLNEEHRDQLERSLVRSMATPEPVKPLLFKTYGLILALSLCLLAALSFFDSPQSSPNRVMESVPEVTFRPSGQYAHVQIPSAVDFQLLKTAPPLSRASLEQRTIYSEDIIIDG